MHHPHHQRYGADKLGEIREIVSGKLCRIETGLDNRGQCYVRESGMHEVYDTVKACKFVWECFTEHWFLEKIYDILMAMSLMTS